MSQSHHFLRSPLPFVTTLCHSLLFFCDVLLCDVKSHTTLHQCQFFCDVLLCDAKSDTTLRQCQVSQFYLSVARKHCFPTSFDNITTSTASTPLQLQLQPQLQLQLHCASLHHTTSCSCGWGDHCNHSKNSTTLRSISGFASPMHHNNSPLL